MPFKLSNRTLDGFHRQVILTPSGSNQQYRKPINPNRQAKFVIVQPVLDRIDRIIWILLLLSPLPDEGEKKQSRPAGNEALDCLHRLVSSSIALSFPMLCNGGSLGEGLGFCLSSGKARNSIV